MNKEEVEDEEEGRRKRVRKGKGSKNGRTS